METPLTALCCAFQVLSIGKVRRSGEARNNQTPISALFLDSEHILRAAGNKHVSMALAFPYCSVIAHRWFCDICCVNVSSLNECSQADISLDVFTEKNN